MLDRLARSRRVLGDRVEDLALRGAEQVEIDREEVAHHRVGADLLESLVEIPQIDEVTPNHLDQVGMVTAAFADPLDLGFVESWSPSLRQLGLKDQLPRFVVAQDVEIDRRGEPMEEGGSVPPSAPSGPRA